MYGKTHEVKFLDALMIRTMDPETIQAVLGMNAKDYSLQLLREAGGAAFGHGINTTDGEEWQRSHALGKPTFSRVEIGIFDGLEFHFRRLVDLLPKVGSDVHLQPLLSRLVSFLPLNNFTLLSWRMSVANFLEKSKPPHGLFPY